MKYPKPQLFKPSEKDFLGAAKKVSENLSDKLQIKSPTGQMIRGKIKAK